MPHEAYVDSYCFKATRSSFRDGWLRTGDIGTLEASGYLRLSDRAKDVIKSGGEWISSVQLENALVAHPDVGEAAVIAMPDERWSERPLACVALVAGRELHVDALREHLAKSCERWTIPEMFTLVDELPKTNTGKLDKRALRGRLREGELELVVARQV